MLLEKNTLQFVFIKQQAGLSNSGGEQFVSSLKCAIKFHLERLQQLSPKVKPKVSEKPKVINGS